MQDIKFINGKIDCGYIYEKVKNKRNIIYEISILNKVLAPFKDMIGMHISASRSNNIFPLYKLNEKFLQINDKKLKFFYKNIIIHKIEIPFQENYWKKALESENLKFSIICSNKIKHIKDTKIFTILLVFRTSVQILIDSYFFYLIVYTKSGCVIIQT